MRRFFIDIDSGQVLGVGDRVSLDAEQSKHVRAVLRYGDGDEIELTDGAGRAISGTIDGGGKRDVCVMIAKVSLAEREVVAPRIVLAVAVVKGKRFEMALEKAVELGVHAIVPMKCERGVIDPRDGKQDRWRGLLVSALKQSGRCHLPELRPLSEPAAVLDDAVGPVLFGAAPGDLVGEKPLHPTAAAAQAARLRLAGQSTPEQLTVMVGPEGGWSPAELQLMAVRDVVPLVLGPHVLRTETAAVVAVAALQQIRHSWIAAPA